MTPQRTRWVILAAVLSAAGGAWGQYNELVPVTATLASDSLDPALMCLSIYTDARVTGWEGPSNSLESLPLDDLPSGFHAGLYERSCGGVRSMWLAFRGTQATSAEDWKTDLLQALGEEPGQYQLARERSQTLKAYALRHGNEVQASLTGHSLGAGLASFGGLCWRLPACCFASVALGSGTQRTATRIHPDALRRAPEFLTHFFIKGDLVKETGLLMGGHFGRIGDPEFDLPNECVDRASKEKLLRLVELAGIDFGPLAKRGATVSYLLDKVSRHSMTNYIPALLGKTDTSPDGLVVLGFWNSKGSFLKVSSVATCFALKANGTVALENEISVLGDKSYTFDYGLWDYTPGRLVVRLPSFATMTYDLVAHDGSKAVQWQRSSVTPDSEGFLREWRRTKGSEGNAALLLLTVACRAMSGRNVSWIRSDHDLFSDLKP